MAMRRFTYGLASLMIFQFFLANPAWAINESQRLSQQDAIQLKQAGTILPLQSVIQRVKEKFKGTIIEVELEGESDDGDTLQPFLIYEIKLLDLNGNRIDLVIDAKTGEFINIEGDPDYSEDDEPYKSTTPRTILP